MNHLLTFRSLASEGTHAKYHYLICGVQGDFTRSLVNDPPRQIWTRELKVSPHYSRSRLRCPTIRSRLLPFSHCALLPQMIGVDFQLSHSRLSIIVRWCLEYFHALQAWYPDMHWYRLGRCAFHLSAEPQLVSHIHCSDTGYILLNSSSYVFNSGI